MNNINNYNERVGFVNSVKYALYGICTPGSLQYKKSNNDKLRYFGGKLLFRSNHDSVFKSDTVKAITRYMTKDMSRGSDIKVQAGSYGGYTFLAALHRILDCMSKDTHTSRDNKQKLLDSLKCIYITDTTIALDKENVGILYKVLKLIQYKKCKEDPQEFVRHVDSILQLLKEQGLKLNSRIVISKNINDVLLRHDEQTHTKLQSAIEKMREYAPNTALFTWDGPKGHCIKPDLSKVISNLSVEISR